MHVLVTGGTGLVGKSAVDHLLARGHTVRLFAGDASESVAQWPEGVEPRDGNVGSDESVRGIARGCDAVLHVVGIVAENPPTVTFQNVNVEGTRRVVHEAERAGVGRFVYVSSLGADTGESDYHRSKQAAEDIVRGFRGDWRIVRPGNVYGPGDEVISLMLKLVRVFPVLPVIGDGDQPFQPIWVEDLGEALALATERDDLAGRVLEVAGTERTTTNQLVDRFAELTHKKPRRLPIPEWLAETGAKAAEAVGLPLPINADQITMLREGNVLEGANALNEILGVTLTPLDEGLARLVNAQPERLPSEGVGALRRDRFWADIRGSRLPADDLFELVCRDFHALAPGELMKIGVESDSGTCLQEGETLTLWIPLRGNVQVRVEEVRDRTASAVTLRGHPLSGVIRFLVEEHGELLRFEVRSYTRASDLPDKIVMDTVGAPLRRATWKSVVEEVVRRSGGEAADGVHAESETLDDQDARGVEKWVEELVRRRAQRAPSPASPGGIRTAG